MSEATKIQGYGAPGESVVGEVGQKYVDLNTNREFVCVGSNTYTRFKGTITEYFWRPLPPSSSGGSIGEHTHDLDDIEGLDEALDAKVDDSDLDEETVSNEELNAAMDALREEFATGLGGGIYFEIVDDEPAEEPV